MLLQAIEGRGAVVTGGGSGIGRAIALALARAGMDVVVADIESAPAERVREEVRALGRRSIAVPTDVSKAAEVEALAAASFDAFGDVAVLVNNAGVSWRPYRASWDASLEDFAWIMSVNFGGVLHGHHAFVPRMRDAGRPAHIVNTASRAVLQPTPGHSAYTASKAAIDGFSMAARAEYEAAGLDIAVSVLYPGPVRTGLAASERFQPAGLRSDARGVVPWERYTDGRAMLPGAQAADAVEPATVGDAVLEAIVLDAPYVMTHPVPPFVAQRAAAIAAAAPAH